MTVGRTDGKDVVVLFFLMMYAGTDTCERSNWGPFNVPRPFSQLLFSSRADGKRRSYVCRGVEVKGENWGKTKNREQGSEARRRRRCCRRPHLLPPSHPVQLPADMSWLESRTESHHALTVAGVLILGSYTGIRPAVYPFCVARCTALSAVFMLLRGEGMCFSPRGGRMEDSDDSKGARNRAGGRFVLSLRTISLVCLCLYLVFL